MQLISKYHNGELDARAMHQLEKEAQNDPFLMEALEGYELSGTDQQPNLADVYARLRDRTQKAERRIIPWKWLSIAASILVVLTIGGLLLRHQSPEVKNTLVKVAKPKLAPPLIKPDTDTVEKVIQEQGITKQIAKNKPHLVNKTYRYTPPVVNEAFSAPVLANDKVLQYKKDTTNNLAEVPIVGYSTQKKLAITGSISSIPPGYLAPPFNSELSGKVAGVNVAKDRNKSLVGIVKDETNQPIPGATVAIKGTNKATITDANGKFVLPDVSNSSTLDVNFAGYNKKEMTVKDRDSLVIAMQPNSRSLSEVVVTGYGVKRSNDDADQPVYEGAHPNNGWSDFKKYLKDNAASPDGKTGVVKVTFKVDEYGNLSGFKVKRSLSTETDNAAIQLLQDGPSWISNSNHTAETVTVRIRFEIKK